MNPTRRICIFASGLGLKQSVLAFKHSALGFKQSTLGIKDTAPGFKQTTLGFKQSTLGSKHIALRIKQSALMKKPRRLRRETSAGSRKLGSSSAFASVVPEGAPLFSAFCVFSGRSSFSLYENYFVRQSNS